MKRHEAPVSRNQRGQASIMIGMMMMTFILFFAFVVNTGMLVNAKINLQNAADMAAYSGAAVQARTLNQISYLNYEMRRQYKKFLFRYYVMGNLALAKFPRGSGGGGPAKWSPDGNADYGVPVVCLIFNNLDNPCQLVALPKIEIPVGNTLDQIQSTLISQLQAIENIRQSNCLKIGVTNTTALSLWLWNTDPSLSRLAKSDMNPDIQQSIKTIQGLSYGMGLIPRELILRMRIGTLNDYVNNPPHKGVTLDTINAMKGTQDPAATERTIEAYLSAFYSLGENTFSSGDVVMDELMPSSMLELKNIDANFDTFAIDFMLKHKSGKIDRISEGSDPGECTPIVQAVSIKKNITLGVAKDPSVLTYYAVKIKAKAKVMFSPFGDMELKAYAAAQPFGSRIGPPLALDGSDFIRKEKPTGPLAGDKGSDFNFVGAVPNLAIRTTGDSSDTGGGWDTQEALSTYYGAFSAPGAQPGALPLIDGPALERAYQAAMVPNPYEANRYNIINDIGSDPFVHNFDASGMAAFWAPIIAPDKKAQASAILQDLVKNKIEDVSMDSTGQFKAAIVAEFTQYFAKLDQQQGENGEGFNIVRLQNPIAQVGGGNISLGKLSETDPAAIKSSWNGVLNGAFHKLVRLGYSVKFVSFDSLVGKRLPANDSTTWSNTIPGDADADADLPLIRH